MQSNRRIVVVERPRCIVPTANRFRFEAALPAKLDQGQPRIRASRGLQARFTEPHNNPQTRETR